MKKTGIAAMMLSTAIAVSRIAVPVCAAPGQTAESSQMQEQPQTETEPAKSISDEDFAKLLDFGLVHSTVFSSNLLEHRYRKTDGRSFCIRVTPYSRSGSHINEVLWIFADEDVE